MALFCVRDSKPAKRPYVTLQSPQPKPTHRCIRRIEENASSGMSVEEIRDLQNLFPRFGPAYRMHPDPFQASKNEAWKQILKKSEEEESQVREGYLNVLRQIERDARDSYHPSIINDLKSSEFNWMMIIDGCFFLQSVLHILGGTEVLDYPAKHPHLGLDSAYAQRTELTMFFPGNQIPCVVIRALMKQPFFQDVIERGIARGKWNPPPDLPRMLLYLLVVHPELQIRGIISSPGFFSKLLHRKNEVPHFWETPLDLIDGWYSLVVGPAYEPEYRAFDRAVDVEDPDRNRGFPSATELAKKGITLRKGNGGLREIYFKKKFSFFGYLYVPPLRFDDRNTDFMFECLINYENAHQISNNEVAVYFRFLKDFIRSKEDVKLLKSKGIIYVKRDLMNELAEMINNFGSSEIAYTENYRLARLDAVNYSYSPWVFRGFIFILFTLVATIFSILAYLVPASNILYHLYFE